VSFWFSHIGNTESALIHLGRTTRRSPGKPVIDRRPLIYQTLTQRMGVRQERVSAIERAEPGATEVRTLAGYVEALGGRLEIVADFGGDRILLH
jgi:hypothetical protein